MCPVGQSLSIHWSCRCVPCWGFDLSSFIKTNGRHRWHKQPVCVNNSLRGKHLYWSQLVGADFNGFTAFKIKNGVDEFNRMLYLSIMVEYKIFFSVISIDTVAAFRFVYNVLLQTSWPGQYSAVATAGYDGNDKWMELPSAWAQYHLWHVRHRRLFYRSHRKQVLRACPSQSLLQIFFSPFSTLHQLFFFHLAGLHQ